MEKSPTEQRWIETGYTLWAYQGPHAIQVERMAQEIGISKTSFYHYFQDKENFIEQILAHHLHRAEEIRREEMRIRCIDPELIELLLRCKTDLLFNRQLRIAKEHARYAEIVAATDARIGYEFVRIWQETLRLPLKEHALLALFELALENFYLQINPSNLNYDWLKAYFDRLSKTALQFR